MLAAIGTCDATAVWHGAVAARVGGILREAPLTPAYRTAVAATLASPGNALSVAPDARWSRLVCTCCTAAGGDWERAVPAGTAVELLMLALDILDDIEDGEEHTAQAALGPARVLNVSTGLLLLAQQALPTADCPEAARTLLEAGLRACSGQHDDLAPSADRRLGFEAALGVAAGKSASLVAAICQPGAQSAGAGTEVQALYARFGWHLGLVKQLANDIAAIRPGSVQTDSARGRPTLPLTAAALQVSGDGEALDPWRDGPAHLTWAVAEMYRQRALALVPQLAGPAAARGELVALLAVL